MIGLEIKIEKQKFPVVGSVEQTLHLGPQQSEEPEDWRNLVNSELSVLINVTNT